MLWARSQKYITNYTKSKTSVVLKIKWNALQPYSPLHNTREIVDCEVVLRLQVVKSHYVHFCKSFLR